ncbi:MAG: hypothetical protein IKN65_02635 [Clostridia bacterium]|nr:hypothetical protein [Clostridia bacterium]
MFKFKMSLLFQNVKFRVAVVVLVIASIIAGIVYIPRNKAGGVNNSTQLTSNQIISEAAKLIGKGYSSNGYGGGHGVNFNVWDANQKYDGTKNKLLSIGEFSQLDCTGLVYYTLTKLGVSTSGFLFQNPVPVDPNHWYYTSQSAKVTKGTSSLKFSYKGATKNVQVLKAGEKVSQRPYYMCENGTEIPSGTVVISNGASLGANYHDHGWIYIGNLETTDVKEVAKTLIKDFGVSANLLINGDVNGNFTIKTYKNTAGKTVDVIQKTDANSTHWRIECTADSTGNGVYINNGDPRVDYQNEGANKLVGPIYAFKFAEQPVVSGNYTVELVKVREDGTTVITSDEATFDINGESKNTAKGVLNIVSGKKIANVNQNDTYTITETKAPNGFVAYNDTIKLNVGFKKVGTKYVIDSSKTSCTAPGLTGTIYKVSEDNAKITVYVPNTEKRRNPEGQYSVELIKVKEDGKTVITSDEATFSINNESKTTSKGVLNVVSSKNITGVDSKDSYTIKETKAPNGYQQFTGSLNLDVAFKLDPETNRYLIDSEKTKGTGFNENTRFEVSPNGSKITVYVVNTENGSYNVELYKVDDKGNVINTPAKFEINGKEATTKNGKIEVASNVVVTDDTIVGQYTIKETQAPENYKLFDGTISLGVKMSKVNNKLVLTNDGITFNVDGQNKNAKFVLEGSTIKIYVPNTHKIFDLSLRNYITEIDGVKVDPSREPIINEESIKILQETGTAAYFHIKDSIGVTVGSEVELTIRVYNEGEILGHAKEITDYLPEGLSFLRISDKSTSEYSTTSAVGSKVVVLNYNGNKDIKSLRDFFGKSEVNVTNDYYQEVKIICKVENTDVHYITSRSEITNYGYTENGVWKEAKEVGNVDVDSAQNTIKDALDLDNWYENAKAITVVDKNGKTLVYYPGTQDDDDFETVEILSGKYNIVIKKVDSADGKTVLAGAYFSVNGNDEVGPTNANGEVTLVKGVQIKNDKQVDNYTIKETKAPADYNLYNGEIKVKVATKFSGKTFVIDSEKTTVDGKNVTFSTNKENTTLTIVVPNTKKVFDLSLRKFITEVNGKELTTSREPKVDVSKLAKGESTTATYTHPKNPVDVNTTDVVTYTIRVYNEGELDGYAAEIMDDIPEGLVFLPENEVNKEYKWVMYKEVAKKSDKSVVFDGKNYEVTNNAKEAKIIVTKYLALENGNDNLIKSFNGKELNYKDVKAAFKVVEPTTSDRVLINNAQITDDTDSTGKSVTDRDSTTNKWIDGEDDQDYDAVKVRYFDLALRKWVTKAIVYENGLEKVTETNHGPWDDPEPVVKVDLKNTNIDNVKVKFEYSIRIYNQGEIAGYAKEVSDYIPEGLKFEAVDNPQWKEVDGKIVTRALENTLLQPGEYADVTVILTWINGANNLGLKTNIAEISEDYNEWGTPDIDSTPNNKVPGEDDIDDAPVILAIRTGEPIVYTGVAVAALAIVSLGAVVIRKRILK